jgi:hypothetical protein
MIKMLALSLTTITLFGCREEVQKSTRFLSSNMMTACDSSALETYAQVSKGDTIILYYPVNNGSGYVPNCNDHDWPYVQGWDLQLTGIVLDKDTNADLAVLHLRIIEKDPASVLVLMEELNVGDTTWQRINDVRIVLK